MKRNLNHIFALTFGFSLALSIAGCGGASTPHYTVPDAADLPITGASTPGDEQLD